MPTESVAENRRGPSKRLASRTSTRRGHSILAKMIDRPSGLGAQATPEFEEEKRAGSARRRRASRARVRAPARSTARSPTFRSKTVYGPEDVAHLDLARDLACPGEYPYTRGIHPNGYRDRLWTMRQFAGFGNAKQTNERYHFLLAQGQHGLSVAFDMPTLMGYDSDAPQARGEVGKCGVAIDSLRRHGSALRRHRHGRHHDVDDDQRSGRDRASRNTSRPPRRRAFRAPSSAARFRPTSSKNTSRRKSGSFRRGRTCASSST